MKGRRGIVAEEGRVCGNGTAGGAKVGAPPAGFRRGEHAMAVDGRTDEVVNR